MVSNKEINLSALFPGASSFSEGTAPEENTDSGLGWYGLLLDMAKEGIFGDIKETDKQGVFDIFLYLYNNHLKQQKSKRR